MRAVAAGATGATGVGAGAATGAGARTGTAAGGGAVVQAAASRAASNPRVNAGRRMLLPPYLQGLAARAFFASSSEV
jgi:hypothetical protein